jgi:DNA adenine methylase
MPEHRTYVEPFGGGANVLLRKPRAHVEVYNDLHSGVVNLFRVLRCHDMAAELLRRMRLMPFSREEFGAAYEVPTDPVDAALRLVARSFMGFGSTGIFGTAKGTGFRIAKAGDHDYAGEWARLPDHYGAIVERFAGVVIEHDDAVNVLERYDDPSTLHFIDPPYVHDTRPDLRTGRCYYFEMSDAEHVALLARVQDLAGKVIICGYPSELYDIALKNWHRLSRKATALSGAARTEVIWLNYEPVRPQSDLFTEGSAMSP